MERPCFLVVDREYPGGISTRKLVIETAKFNVLTAYDPEEGIQYLKRFPNVDGVVINAQVTDLDGCRQLIETLQGIAPHIEIVITSASGFPRGGPNEHYVDNFDPKSLLACLQSLKPDATEEIRARESMVRESS